MCILVYFGFYNSTCRLLLQLNMSMASTIQHVDDDSTIQSVGGGSVDQLLLGDNIVRCILY